MANTLKLQFENNVMTLKNILHNHSKGYIILNHNLLYEIENAIKRSEEFLTDKSTIK